MIISYFIVYVDIVTLGGEDLEDEYLISEGNAYLNGLGRYQDNSPRAFDFDISEKEVEINMVYLNCDGFLYPDCDLSYSTQRDWVYEIGENILPNIKNGNMYKQMNNYNKIIKEY